MKIGLEAERANMPNPTGVEHYAAELIRHLAVIDHKNEYVLYFRTKPQEWFYKLPPNFKIKIIPFPKFWTQLRLSWETFWHPVDVLVILAAALPLYHPKKSVAMIHDIAYEIFDDVIYTGFMKYYQKFSSRFAVRFAARVMAASEATKQDLIRKYGTDPSKITVTYMAVDHDKYHPIGYADTQAVLDKYNLSYKKYILFLGTLQPRKNLVRLIDAYIKLRKENRIEEKLVIAGGKGWLWEPIVKKLEQTNISDTVKHLGYVDEADKTALYNGAVLLTLPALYEGFGLPPLEAMACGTPVVVSDISSLPEVVGDAAEFVDPKSTDSIAEGLLKVLADKELQKQMSEKGIRRAQQFNWKKTAQETLALIESLAK